MITIRETEIDGVRVRVDYDPDARVFLAWLPWSKKGIRANEEYKLNERVSKAIQTRSKRNRRVRPLIRFLGSTGPREAAQELTYRGVNLNTGAVSVLNADEEDIVPSKVYVIKPSEQGRLAMAQAVYTQARSALFEVWNQCATEIAFPYTTSWHDGEDTNMRAEETITKRLREAL